MVGDALLSIAVHIGARVATRSGVGEFLVSGTVKDAVAGSGIRFEYHPAVFLPDKTYPSV